MTWATDLKKLTDTGKQNLETLSLKVKFDVFSKTLFRTHVQEGLLRGNWQIQENRAAQGELDRLDPTGSIVDAEIAKEVTADGLTYFTNNLPYAQPREDEDAMVGASLAEVRQIVRHRVAALR